MQRFQRHEGPCHILNECRGKVNEVNVSGGTVGVVVMLLLSVQGDLVSRASRRISRLQCLHDNSVIEWTPWRVPVQARYGQNS